ncbi:acyl-CoA dehydrogenase family protein [Neoroseomonas oryzicola]|uniref:Acyl-CoA dehydrogenase n=1 Tax=Neoroseomonas oryzicola TaxID=535904 RepID=A0A9X9WME9_9PROT|nr:acyl-CoA dehydrogenase family protein [Neoroseomonas oryzicola]MBR0661509.1 acyl-CoA dehydrogenase [Neoroseomonas oryzicola]NKE19079.1 acyl-CoA dehydrogenase [Neoroseomonas oryzicola]
MDFTLPPEIEEIRQRIRRFVDERLIPLESDRVNYDEHENIAPHVLKEMRRQAKAEGLWALQMPRRLGGMELPRIGMAACYEEMNRSIFGPVVFNSAAPDDGNMMILDKVLPEAMKAEWLQPIVDGAVQSAFAMTEPDGCGSDPNLTYTRADRVGNDRWRITGRKWFITGAGNAQIFIIIARTSDDERKGLSAFLFKAETPGWKIVRRIPIMGPEEHGGHCELEFDGLEIPDSQRLLNIGDGLKLTQMRLGVARLTHCMRWTGLARRSLEIAMERIKQRDSFGMKLIDRESVQGLVGQAAMEIEIGRMLTMRAAWALDQGSFARKEVSMAKIVVADALQKSVDTALQLLGARGYSKDTVIEWIYRYARQARLVDGASEVHRMVLANLLRAEGDGFFRWGQAGHG